MNILLVALFFNEKELMSLNTDKLFQESIFIVCTQLNGFNNCYLALIILFNIFSILIIFAKC